MCPKGYASETGLALSMTGLPVPRPLGCKPCPTGYFQDLEGQKYCIECPNQSKSRKNKEATVSVYECERITRINWNEEVTYLHRNKIFCSNFKHDANAMKNVCSKISSDKRD